MKYLPKIQEFLQPIWLDQTILQCTLLKRKQPIKFVIGFFLGVQA